MLTGSRLHTCGAVARRHLASLVVALGLVVCGCDKSNGGDVAREESPGTPTSDARNDASKDESDLAEDLLLTIDDFPAGWVEREAQDRGFEECDGNAPGKTGEAEAGQFSEDGTFTVVNLAAVFERPVQIELDRFEESVQCVVDAINDGELDDTNATFFDASFGSLSFPEKGDESRAFRISFRGESREESTLGNEAEFHYDIVVVRVGRIGLLVGALDIHTPPRPAEWEPFVDIAVGRASDTP